jgi:uncharacterized protein YecE (DUF72 family)
VFYPPGLPAGRWFDFYSRHFDTVEVNNSFYRLPSSSAFAAWRNQAPPGFLYAVKASRYLTHLKKLKDPEVPLENFFGRARELGRTLGPVLYQLPPHWRCDVGRLRHFVAALPPKAIQVVEFRDPSWYVDAVREVLAEAGVGFCVHDMKGLASPLWVTGPAAYVRFHGPAAVKYAGSYPAAHLRRWADRVREWHGGGHAVYAYFNNDGGGAAVRNAATLREMVGAAVVTR